MASCRFAVAVHTLAVLACRKEKAVSSDTLARSINTNPVVVRRLLCDLREAGLVQTQKGVSGGTLLTRPPESISLREVYEAVECSSGLVLPQQAPNPECPIGRRMELLLPEIFAQAQEAMAQSLAQRTLADLMEPAETAAR